MFMTNRKDYRQAHSKSSKPETKLMSNISTGEAEEKKAKELDAEKKKHLVSDCVAKYFNDISGYDVLSREEEVRLFNIMHGSNRAEAKKAKEKLILCNLKLVASISNRFKAKSMKPEDLFQEGVIGLMRAIEKYDASKGFKLSTYATWWIRQSVTRALADRESEIRMPVKFYEETHDYLKAQRDLVSEKGGIPTRRETVIRMLQRGGSEKPTEEQIERLLGRMTSAYTSRNMVPLDAPAGDDGVSEMMDFVASEDCLPDKVAEKDALADEIREVMHSLDPREEFVICARYGLPNTTGLYDGYEITKNMTLEEIAGIIGVTRERVRQLELMAIKSMQKGQYRERLRPFLSGI